jgi:hypothetical protein
MPAILYNLSGNFWDTTPKIIKSRENSDISNINNILFAKNQKFLIKMKFINSNNPVDKITLFLNTKAG